ncbi:MAG: nitroreductase [Neisseriaceae bacterium]|nr:nitroreductase [Neisseriaceae bacterium]
MMPTNIDDIIRTRRSTRAFTKQAVDLQIVREILQTASFAPSGTNTQPWKVYVVSGNKRDEICNAVSDAVRAVQGGNLEKKSSYTEVFPYYPVEWISPYIDRRRQNGWELYGLLGIQKGDKEKMHAQHLRNYQFFDAPIGMFFTVNKIMGIGARMDIAMLMQNIMLSAHARGLATCAQAAWNAYHSIVLPLLGASDDELLLSAMALGYKDKDAIVNTLKPPRAPVEEFSVWLS